MIATIAQARSHAAPTGPQAISAPATYLPLLRRMVEDLRDTPAALGAYALIARLYLISNVPVPLSPRDLQAYDPTLSYGAARRALERLADTSYALVDVAPGRKATFVPTWGLVNGTPHSWDRTAPLLGQPRHLRAVRLDDRMLDLCLGRLRPSATHPAVVERYIAAPLLGLRDVGGYALALVGLGEKRPALTRLGLLSPEGAPLPLPDDQTILAIASQRLQDEARDGLTRAGYSRAGLVQPAPAAPAGQALFFVPPGVIGGVIGRVIGSIVESEQPMMASQCPETALAGNAARSHGWDGKDGDSTTPTPAGGSETAHAGGGAITSSDNTDEATAAARSLPTRTPLTRAENGATTPPAPPAAEQLTVSRARPEATTESERQLRALGVRVDVARQLAERPAVQVARVIAQARTRPGVRDLSAWVVSALRALPADDTTLSQVDDRPPSAMPIYTHPGLSDPQRDRWIRMFHAAVSPTEKRAVLTRLEQEYPR